MMGKILKYKVLAAGILSPPAAAFLGLYAYARLTRASTDLNQDFVPRLMLVILAMVTPFVVTLLLAFMDSRHGTLTRSSKAGLSLAVLSLGLTWMPIRGLIGRVQQAQNVAIRDVAAPPFDTVDILGKPHRLHDHLGKVVLINAWATWCGPCREEMPELDRLYQKRKDEGLIVFGLSTEEVALQQKFVTEQLSVSYPLLTADGDVPSLYRDIQRWPALFLIDRKGQLHPVAQAGEPFEKVEAAVDALLKGD
jgi:thiol-disulfide isomerase/thioredoxin